MKSPAAPASSNLAELLSQTKVFQDYESAFRAASGLPLVLQDLSADSGRKPLPTGDNAFCQLMARDHAACAECLKLRHQVACRADAGPGTLQCFAGLCETAVPVRVGKDTVAFLQTGHVMLHPPDKKRFSRISRSLLNWGAAVDLKRAEHAWLATRVLKPGQYRALVRLLEVFSQHLGIIAERLPQNDLHRKGPPEIQTAIGFIREHSTQDLVLADVARVVNWSTHYFSKKFAQVTGLGFTEYVNRVRIEQARQLLANPALRVSEVAFATGFQSLSQFNRTFRKVTARSPSEFRRSSRGD